MNKKLLNCDFCNIEFYRYKSAKNRKYNYCSLYCNYEHKRVKSIEENKSHVLKLDKDFVNWFSGFWEGEGSLITCDISRKRKTPRFTLYQSDLKVIKYIKNKFKLGRISKQKNNNLSTKTGYVFQTSKFGECVLFAYILKDKLRSKYKKDQLNKWIKQFKMKDYFKYIRK